MKKQKPDEVEKYLEEFTPEAKKDWIKKSVIDFVEMGVNRLGAVMPNLAQNCFIAGNFVPACSAMAFWLFQGPVSRFLKLKNDIARNKVDQIHMLDAEEKAIEVMNMTRNKTTKTIENESGYKVDKKMEPSEVVFLSGNYINQAKNRRDNFVNTGISIATTGILVASSVALGIQNAGNIPLFLGVMGGSIATSGYMSYRRLKRSKIFEGKFVESGAKMDVAKQDIYNVRATNEKHQDFMVDKYREASLQKNKDMVEMWKGEGKDAIIDNLVNSVALAGLVGASLIGTKQIDINTIASIFTLANMYRGVIDTSQRLVYNVAGLKKSEDRFKQSKEAMKDILPVYSREKAKERDFDRDEIHNISIHDFEYEYCGEKGEKDRHVIIPRLELEAGETLLITGRSGSGKSTFMKAVMGMNSPEIEGKPITINGDKQVDKLYNVIFNDDVKDIMGNNTLLEELTFSKDKKDIDFDKLERVLEGVDLLDYLKAKFPDRDLKAVLESAYFSTFSGGESAKLKLARMLYQLDDKTDIICMDEPTGRLDPRSAVKVMKFVKEFANEDKKRVMIMVSHDLNLMQSDVYDKWQYIDDNFTFQEIHDEQEKKELLKVYPEDINKEKREKFMSPSGMTKDGQPIYTNTEEIGRVSVKPDKIDKNITH